MKGALTMELTYSTNGDYLIPDLELDTQPTESIGKYGMMRKSFLMEHRKGTYGSLILQNKLTEHLLEIDQTAKAQVEQMVAQMAKAEGVTEELKARDQMKWVGLMNTLKAQAEEIVLAELIYS
ncbi:MAG TPA: TnpV protein [Clostridia bacterium]|nr:TnpV protein [Clostridia bacterium]